VPDLLLFVTSLCCSGDLTPTTGQIRRNAHLRFARYHQHLEDQLDFSLTPLAVRLLQGLVKLLLYLPPCQTALHGSLTWPAV
jgi:hypothetical protein